PVMRTRMASRSLECLSSRCSGSGTYRVRWWPTRRAGHEGILDGSAVTGLAACDQGMGTAEDGNSIENRPLPGRTGLRVKGVTPAPRRGTVGKHHNAGSWPLARNTAPAEGPARQPSPPRTAPSALLAGSFPLIQGGQNLDQVRVGVGHAGQ